MESVGPTKFYASLAQLGERRSYKSEAVGSKPTRCTMHCSYMGITSAFQAGEMDSSSMQCSRIGDYKMSRSKRKTSIMGFTTARSEKEDKRINNRKLRKRIKVAMREDAEIFPLDREVSNVWTMAKDGKQMFNPSLNNGKWMRK